MASQRMLTTVLLAVLGTAWAAPLRAEDPAGQKARRQRLIERFDRNGDGQLSAEERKALREFLVRFRGKQHKPIPQTVFPGKTDLYKLADGAADLTVVETYMLADARRDRQIPLRITIPAGKGPSPLILFCHGALGSKDGAQPLAKYWASHGYVVIQPTFGDSISLMSEAEKRQFDSPVELVNAPRTLEHWDDRPRDVSCVIDSLDRLQREIEPLAGRIDADRIAVAGHSFGAHTSMLLAGLRLEPPSGLPAPDFRDPRIDAAVLISPQGPGKSIRASSYKAMQGPLLMITGDNDGSPIKGQTDKGGAWRREAFDHARPGDRYLLWIQGAYHGFGGINGPRRGPNSGPVAPDHVFYVKSTALAFFDAYLRSDAAAKAYLRGDRVDRVTKGKAKLTAK